MRSGNIEWLPRRLPLRWQHIITNWLNVGEHLLDTFHEIEIVGFDQDEVFNDLESALGSWWNGSFPELRVKRVDRNDPFIEQDVLSLYNLNFIAEQLDEQRLNAQIREGRRNDLKTLVKRALREEITSYLNRPGVFADLPIIWENVEQIRRILRLMKRLNRCPECGKRYRESQFPKNGFCVACDEPLVVPRYKCIVVTRCPSHSTTGASEKVESLKAALGDDYWLLHAVYIATGSTGDKSLFDIDVLFDDHTSIRGLRRRKHFVHIVVESPHNQNFKPSSLQRRVTRGGDWIKEAGLKS